MDRTAEIHFVERRQQERRQSIRRMQDHNGHSERHGMAVVVYVGAAVVAGAAFAIGMWAAWLMCRAS